MNLYLCNSVDTFPFVAPLFGLFEFYGVWSKQFSVHLKPQADRNKVAAHSLSCSPNYNVKCQNAFSPTSLIFSPPHLGDRVQHAHTFTYDSLVNPWVEAV